MVHLSNHKTTSFAATSATITAGAFLPKSARMERRFREQYELGRAAIAAEIFKGTKTDLCAAEQGHNLHSLRKLKTFARACYTSGDTQTKGRTSLEKLCRLRRKAPSSPDIRLGLH